MFLFDVRRHAPALMPLLLILSPTGCSSQSMIGIDRPVAGMSDTMLLAQNQDSSTTRQPFRFIPESRRYPGTVFPDSTVEYSIVHILPDSTVDYSIINGIIPRDTSAFSVERFKEYLRKTWPDSLK